MLNVGGLVGLINLNNSMRNFFSNVQVSGLVYGSPLKPHADEIKRKGKALEGFLLDPHAQERFMNRPFPKNDSDETKRELIEIHSRTSSLSDEEYDFGVKAERNHFKEWSNFCMNHGIIVHEYVFKQMESNTDGLIYFLKNHYNRPRPFQLGLHLGIPVEPVINHGANSAAYPGGHSFDATLISLVLSSKYPRVASKFEEFANQVSESRLNMGFHYPSDNEFGVELAKWVFSKELY